MHVILQIFAFLCSVHKSLPNMKPKRKRKPISSRSTAESPSFEEKLKQRFLKKHQNGGNTNKSSAAADGKNGTKRVADIPPHLHKDTRRRGDGSTEFWTVHNPASYNRLVSRLEESQVNKVKIPDGHIEDAPWICALCGRKTCRDGLGDLFGPYYQSIQPETLWPPFLPKPKTSKRKKSSIASADSEQRMWTDLWFHGDCLVWAAGLLLKGTQIIGLEDHMMDYWEQKCGSCAEWGASVSCASKGCSKSYHYPCAVSTGCLFREANLSSWCPVHAKKI